MGEQRLKIAIGAALAEVAVQMAFLVANGALSGAPLRIVFLAAKVPFCLLAGRRRAGAYLAVWLYEIAAVVAAIGAAGPVLNRLGFGAASILVMVLLGRASAAFPPVEWKTR